MLGEETAQTPLAVRASSRREEAIHGHGFSELLPDVPVCIADKSVESKRVLRDEFRARVGLSERVGKHGNCWY